MKARNPKPTQKSKNDNTFKILIVALATAGYLGLATGLPGLVALAESGPAAPGRPPADEPALDFPDRNGNDEAFVYKREGRTDPFVPFVTEKVIQAEEQKEELTGLQRFEAGQLTLVAIVIGDGDRFAMVQDSVGKGYVIRQGTKIGRAGAVDEIAANRVIIKIPSRSMAGEIRYNTVEMLLKKEGEK